MGSTETIASEETTARPRLPRAVRERQMLDVAVAAFGERGYHGVAMDEIADGAGISKPMVYAYFGSKEGLYLACLRHTGAALVDAIRKATETGTADQRLWNGCVTFLEHIRANENEWRLLRRVALSDNSEFAQEIASLRTKFCGLIAGIVAETVDVDGLNFRFPEGTMPLAQAIIGAAESLGNWWITAPDIPVERAATYLMNFLWVGLSELSAGQLWKPHGLYSSSP